MINLYIHDNLFEDCNLTCDIGASASQYFGLTVENNQFVFNGGAAIVSSLNGASSNRTVIKNNIIGNGYIVVRNQTNAIVQDNIVDCTTLPIEITGVTNLSRTGNRTSAGVLLAGEQGAIAPSLYNQSLNSTDSPQFEGLRIRLSQTEGLSLSVDKAENWFLSNNTSAPLQGDANGSVAVGYSDVTAPAARLDVNGDVKATSVKLVPIATPPAQATEGVLYYDSTIHKLRIYGREDGKLCLRLPNHACNRGAVPGFARLENVPCGVKSRFSKQVGVSTQMTLSAFHKHPGLSACQALARTV